MGVFTDRAEWLHLTPCHERRSGIFVVTWMTGKISKMNPVAVFVSLLFWGWLWGVWGLLLAIPIIGIVKVVSQHIKELQPLAELLRE